jgi:hypothetical protein
MGALFRNALNRNRGQILGWGITLGILSMYLMTFYDVLIDQQAQLRRQLPSISKAKPRRRPDPLTAKHIHPGKSIPPAENDFTPRIQ